MSGWRPEGIAAVLAVAGGPRDAPGQAAELHLASSLLLGCAFAMAETDPNKAARLVTCAAGDVFIQVCGLASVLGVPLRGGVLRAQAGGWPPGHTVAAQAARIAQRCTGLAIVLAERRNISPVGNIELVVVNLHRLCFSIGRDLADGVAERMAARLGVHDAAPGRG